MVPSPRHCSLRLPDEFQAQLDRAVRSSPEDGIGRCLVGRVATASESRRRRVIGAGACRSIGVVKDRTVQNVEEFSAKLGGESLFELYILNHGQIPILESPVPEDVSACRPQGSERWRNKDRGAICIAAVVCERGLREPGCRSPVQCHCFGKAGRIAGALEKGKRIPTTRREIAGVTIEIPKLAVRGELIHLVGATEIVGCVSCSPGRPGCQGYDRVELPSLEDLPRRLPPG